jgi:hypothetical protein
MRTTGTVPENMEFFLKLYTAWSPLRYLHLDEGIFCWVRRLA